ncbi:MAG: MFS transporter [Anaerolineae bacterium CG2_30_64_16]|nr:MAG: MFS transporter [Anaerolineae bacterium CG2_30_64_16]
MNATSSKTSGAHWATPFFTIWTAQTFSLLGSSLVQFALVWWLTKTTGSATVLATSTLVAILPQIFVGPFAGTLVDRWNRRIVMIVADGMIALVTLGLACLYMVGAMQVWHVYAIMLLRAVGGGFHWPAMQASTSLMVPEKHLTRVAGANQTLNGAMNIISPPLGALLMGVLPLHNILLIDVGTAALAIAPLLFIHIPQPERSAADGVTRPTSVWADLVAGLRYIRAWPGMMGILVVAMLVNFVINPALSLMPILVTKHFGGGVVQLGWMESAWGVGVVIGGLLLSAWGGFRRRVVTSLTGVVLLGLGSLLLGLLPAHAFNPALASLFLLGFTMPMIDGPFFALMQSRVTPEMQGRVLSLVGSAAKAMLPLSLIVAGPLADAVGVRAWYVAGGATCALIGGAAFMVPAIMHIESNGHGPLPAAGEARSVSAVPATAE